MVQNIHSVQILTMQMHASRIGHFGLRRMFCAIPSERGLTMATRTDDTRTDKRRTPLTRHQKGRRWATVALLVCGAFSIYANVRAGELRAESIVVSVFPPIVAFITSHLISYFNPTKTGHKVLIWGGMGLVTLFAMIGSGTHIVDTVQHTGQIWQIAAMYIFMTDVPMLIAAVILIEKVPTAQTGAKQTSSTTTAKAATSTNGVTPSKATKAAVPAKTAKPAASRTRKTNATTATSTPIFRASVIDDEAEIAA